MTRSVFERRLRTSRVRVGGCSPAPHTVAPPPFLPPLVVTAMSNAVAFAGTVCETSMARTRLGPVRTVPRSLARGASRALSALGSVIRPVSATVTFAGLFDLLCSVILPSCTAANAWAARVFFPSTTMSARVLEFGGVIRSRPLPPPVAFTVTETPTRPRLGRASSGTSWEARAGSSTSAPTVAETGRHVPTRPVDAAVEEREK
jgi:hypothetical protein